MLVTYRLNPAFAVTNLSSSSTSGWRKKQNNQLGMQKLRKVSKKDLTDFLSLLPTNVTLAGKYPPAKFCSLSHRSSSVGPSGIAVPLWMWCLDLPVPPHRTAFQRGELQRLQVYALGWLTLLWSPSKSCKKLAWVPVVPFTPRKRRSSRARSRLCRSMHKSWIHKQQRFPTVVSCAGLETTQNRTWLTGNLHNLRMNTVRCRVCC